MILLATGALAAQRDAWPALPVEQPVWVPRGWTLIDATYEEVSSDPDSLDAGSTVRRTGAIDLRYGFAPRVELWVTAAGGAVDHGSLHGLGLAAPSFGARLGLSRREGPARSAAVLVGVICPWETASGLSLGGGGVRAEVVDARQLGPLRVDLALGGTWLAPGPVAWAGDLVLDPAEEATARVGGSLQIGPLAPGAAVDAVFSGGSRLGTVALPGGWRAEIAATLVVQLSRGLALTGTVGDALAADVLLPPVEIVGPGASAGVRIAL